MLLTGTFDKNKINIPNKYEDDIEVTAAGEILIKYNAATKIIDMANAIKILGASYISNGFDEIQSISDGTASAGETKLAKIIIEGKSQQTAKTQGKNLLDKTKIIIGQAISPTTGAIGNSVYGYRTPYIFVSPSTNYYLGGAQAYDYNFIAYYDASLTYLGRTSGDAISNRTFTTPTNCQYIIFNMYDTSNTPELYTGQNLYNLTANTLQLELGTTATSYEAFVPNSPSPDYPSTINSVSNFNLVSTTSNVLMNGSLENGITSWTVGGTTDNNPVVSVRSENKLVGNYSLYQKVNASSRRAYQDVLIPQGHKVYVSAYCYTVSYETWHPTITINDGGTIANNPVRVVFTNIGEWERKSLIAISAENGLRIGTTDNASSRTWECYWDGFMVMDLTLLYGAGNEPTVEQCDSLFPNWIDNKSSTINFPNTTLRSLPDGTKDYIEIDNINRTAKLYRNVGEVIFNGSESWSVPTPNNVAGIYRYAIGVVGVNSYSNMLCTHMLHGNITNVINAATIGLCSQSNRINVFVNNCTTIAEFESWLTNQYNAGTPVTVQYKLATPTVTDLTYQELQVGYPLTNIYTTSAVKPKIIGQVINK